MPPLPPPRLLLLAVGLLSAASLSYEILLMRLFGIIQWHHFASMLISLALLGYGASGSFLTRYRSTLLPAFGTAFTVNAALFGLSSVACFAIAAAISFNPLEMLWSVREWGRLLMVSIVLMLPFFFAANSIGLGIQRYQDQLGRLYAADLVGAGAGAIAVVALLFLSFPHRALHVVGFVGVAAAVLAYVALGPLPRWVATVLVMTVLALTVLSQGDRGLPQPSEYKALPQLAEVMGTRVLKERSSPLGLLTVMASPDIPLRQAPGLSLLSRSPIPAQLALFTDGDGMTVINHWDGNPASAAFLDEVPSALPFHLLQADPKVLVLGAGGGSDVLQALTHGARQIDAVEFNPQLIQLIRRQYAAFSGGLYDEPRVQLHFADARGFVSASAARYDVIQLALTDSFQAAGTGLHASMEDYLYTRQALADYLSRLSPGGFIAISRWVRLPPRDGIKLFATAIAALEQLGVATPGQRLLWIRNWQLATLLIKNGDLTAGDMQKTRRFCAERAFDVAYSPDRSPAGTNLHTVLDRPYFDTAASALLGPDRERFIQEYPYNIEPATDDRPYFFHFFRWPLLREAWSLKGAGGLSMLDMGYPLLVATLLQALVLSGLMILAPIPALRRTQEAADATLLHRLRPALYFAAIGLAFMFVEIVSIQRFTLYLAHPLYAIPVVLAAFLIFAGVGSRLAAQVSRRSARGRAALAAVAVILLIGLHLLVTPAILHATLHLSSTAKIGLVLGLIAPLAVAMGMLFPLGMMRLTYKESALLPWAYAINGCASVVAAVLASLLAIHFGQTNVLLAAMVLYGIAARFVP